MLKEFRETIFQNESLSKLLFISIFFSILISFSNLLAKELVIALVLDADTIKTNILPATQKQNVIAKMSIPTHLTVMWLKDLPSGYNAKVNELQERLQEKTKKFLADYKSQMNRDFKVVIEKTEKNSAGNILGGIYLLATSQGHTVLTNLIKALKKEVITWKSENPTISVNFYKYFAGDQFLPHITVLETIKAESIFPSAEAKKNYAKEIDETIQNNKPEGFGGIPVSILHTDWWTQ